MTKNIPHDFVLNKKISKSIGEAVKHFSMIRKNDRILVGLSGGKDSNLMLYALARLRRRSPVPFEICALTVDPAAEETELAALRDFAKRLEVRLETTRHGIFDILDSSPNTNPCSLCANIRRGILASKAKEMQCNVLALGHHRDDAVETVLLNLLYTGRFSCFHPHMYMSRSGIRVIRPLIYAAESQIEQEAARLDLPRIDFQCKYAASSKRTEVKRLVENLSKSARDIRSNVIHALKSCRDKGAWGLEVAPDHIHEEEYNDFY